MKELSLAQRFTFFAIMITGALLRFYHYGEWSLSNDELSALNRLHYNSFSEIMEQGVKLNDMHPPGVQAFLYLWTNLFGVSENALRFPFVLLGIGSIFMLFLISRMWFNTNIALLTSAAFATLIFPVLYSQLARPYSPGLFFSLIAVYFWTKLILSEKNSIDWVYNIGFMIAGAACMYIHYFSFLFIGIIGITGLFLIPAKKRLIYTGTGVVMLAMMIPSFSIFKYQLSIGGLGGSGGWLGPPKSNAILLLIQYIFNDSNWLLSFYLLLFITFLIYYFAFNQQSKYKLRFTAVLFFIIPFLIAFFYSIFKNPVYQHSIMLFSFPYFLLFMFSFLPQSFSEKKSISVALLILVLTGLSTIAEKRFYSTQYFAVFKEPVAKTIEYNHKYGEKNLTSVANVFFSYYIDYYHEKFKIKIPYKLYNCSSPAQLAKLNVIASNSNTSYFSYIWSNTANPEEVEQIVSQYYPHLVEKINYFNSGVRLFSSANTKAQNDIFHPVFSTVWDFEKAQPGDDTSMITAAHFYSGLHAVGYTSEKEFGPTFKKKLSDMTYSDGCVIWLKVWIYTDTLPLKASLVLQVDEGNKTVLWRGADANDYVLTPGKWYPVFLAYRFSDPLPKDNILSVYVWNSGKAKFYADDLSIQILN